MRSGKPTISRVPTLCGALVLTAVAAGPAVAGGRVLTPMDVVTIRIVTAPDLDTTARVEEDGTIAFPYLGRIEAAGLTEDQLAERIEEGLVTRKILADPRGAQELRPKKSGRCHTVAACLVMSYITSKQ